MQSYQWFLLYFKLKTRKLDQIFFHYVIIVFIRKTSSTQVWQVPDFFPSKWNHKQNFVICHSYILENKVYWILVIFPWWLLSCEYKLLFCTHKTTGMTWVLIAPGVKVCTHLCVYMCIHICVCTCFECIYFEVIGLRKHGEKKYKTIWLPRLQCPSMR